MPDRRFAARLSFATPGMPLSTLTLREAHKPRIAVAHSCRGKGTEKVEGVPVVGTWVRGGTCWRVQFKNIATKFRLRERARKKKSGSMDGSMRKKGYAVVFFLLRYRRVVVIQDPVGAQVISVLGPHFPFLEGRKEAWNYEWNYEKRKVLESIGKNRRV